MSATLTKAKPTTDWAADEDEDDVLPQPEVIKNKDGTETHISYRINDDGKKIKTIRKIKHTVIRQEVNHRVAERRTWSKFGVENGRKVGPQSDTTTVGENIEFKPRANYKTTQAVEDKDLFANQKAKLKEAKIKCRICSGEHWTSKCPYKDTMAPEGEPGPGLGDSEEPEATQAGSLGQGGSSYVPPHLRKGGAATGERMSGGKYGERDDLATLRVTNVSEFAEEADLREMFGRFGHVTRVFLAKDRDTGRAKGFAFVSFADRSDAAKACEKMDGFGYGHLILRVEFAKKAT
ncbi:translation initiation factor 3, RNA-binding subunit [Rhizodiscina lignyota]|uniref:Eukaryotic translation initiation factor 3 subunit G n=1 Tax=Rhizodiscina lignyota TaxID=1504668 RepID=A0A9P4M8P9_9PEZI|nr:translation initiation factor 3, RNA-binding subunit [Rhizodiscina lignyota]